MNSVQTPLWIPVVAALVGMVGAIGGQAIGQLIGARREDRRWKREFEREDIRWQREKEKLSIEQGNETEKHLKDKRIEAYTDLLVAFQNWESSILDLVKQEDQESAPTAEEVAARIGKCVAPVQDALQRAQAKIDIVGSNSVRKSTEHMRSTLGTIIAKLAGSLLNYDKTSTVAMGVHNLFTQEYDELISAMRQELDTSLPLYTR